MSVTISGFRTEGGSVESGGTLTLSYRVEDFTGSFDANYTGRGVTLNGAATQVRGHKVTSSGQTITDSFTVVGSQGTHSIELVPAAGAGVQNGYTVSFYVA